MNARIVIGGESKIQKSSGIVCMFIFVCIATILHLKTSVYMSTIATHLVPLREFYYPPGFIIIFCSTFQALKTVGRRIGSACRKIVTSLSSLSPLVYAPAFSRSKAP